MRILREGVSGTPEGARTATEPTDDDELCEHGLPLHKSIGCHACFEDALAGAMAQADRGTVAHIEADAPFHGHDCDICDAIRRKFFGGTVTLKSEARAEAQPAPPRRERLLQERLETAENKLQELGWLRANSGSYIEAQPAPQPTPPICPICGSDDRRIRFTRRVGACDQTCTCYWHNMAANAPAQPTKHADGCSCTSCQFGLDAGMAEAPAQPTTAIKRIWVDAEKERSSISEYLFSLGRTMPDDDYVMFESGWLAARTYDAEAAASPSAEPKEEKRK